MSVGTCDPAEIARFCSKWEVSDVRAQEMFRGPYDRYISGNITFDEQCEFSEHNYRYRTHPQTNLSELNTVNLIFSVYPDAVIRVATQLQEQTQGSDIFFAVDNTTSEVYSVSTKLMLVGGPMMRCFTLSSQVIDSLRYDNSDLVAFIDNFADAGILLPTYRMHDVLRTKSLHRDGKGRYMVFYDFFGGTRESMVRRT